MENFTPVSAIAGGALIGLSAAVLWLANGRIAGISGIVGGMLAFLGTLLLGRLVIPALVDLLGRVVGAVTGLRPSAPLAGRTARQSPARTTATARAAEPPSPMARGMLG